jgi:hypothetical protein
MVSWLRVRDGVDRDGATPEAEAEASAMLDGSPPVLPSRITAAARQIERFIFVGYSCGCRCCIGVFKCSVTTLLEFVENVRRSRYWELAAS